MVHAQAGANAVAPINLIADSDDTPPVDGNERKIVTVEKIHLTALDANDKAPPEPKVEVHHRPHYHHHRWHRRRHHRR